MPNWCSNRLEITLHNAADMPALKRWIEDGNGIPDWQTAIAQSIHLLLAQGGIPLWLNINQRAIDL